MLKIQTQDLELTHFHSLDDQSREARADWPVYRDRGSASTAVVYFELEPGKRLGTHTDSAEEVLVVLEGEVEVVVGDERGRVRAGGIAVVPAMEPHDVICAGDARARVAGVFSANTILSAFEGEWQPMGTNIVGTPPPAEVPAG
jgi:quercetin dioxygenase-like cupin family protein